MAPLKHGTSPEVVSGNIKELMKAGHPQKSAIAAALSMKRKSKKMAEGGMVGGELDQDDERGLGEINEMGKYHPESIENPEYQDAERMLARKLQDGSEDEDMNYAGGGLVQTEESNAMAGAKPELGWIDDGTEEAMSDEPMKAASLDHSEDVPLTAESSLSPEAIEAIKMKKMKRMYR